MIEENYVSFETAKLLKEKGFDEATNGYYPIVGKAKETFHKGAAYRWNYFSDRGIAAPTLSMAMEWLRKEHNLHIDVDPSEGNWNPTVLELEDWSCAVKFGDNIPIQDSYEQACEAAIKYCLEKLI